MRLSSAGLLRLRAAGVDPRPPNPPRVIFGANMVKIKLPLWDATVEPTVG
jgi:hypothetical protein